MAPKNTDVDNVIINKKVYCTKYILQLQIKFCCSAALCYLWGGSINIFYLCKHKVQLKLLGHGQLLGNHCCSKRSWWLLIVSGARGRTAYSGLPSSSVGPLPMTLATAALSRGGTANQSNWRSALVSLPLVVVLSQGTFSEPRRHTVGAGSLVNLQSDSWLWKPSSWRKFH